MGAGNTWPGQRLDHPRGPLAAHVEPKLDDRLAEIEPGDLTVPGPAAEKHVGFVGQRHDLIVARKYQRVRIGIGDVA